MSVLVGVMVFVLVLEELRLMLFMANDAALQGEGVRSINSIESLFSLTVFLSGAEGGVDVSVAATVAVECVASLV